MRKDQTDVLNRFMKVGKRIAITILCCIPFLILFSYLTRNVITSDFVQILIFVLIMGSAVLVEELVVRSREKKKKREAVLETKKDVFK